MNVSKFADKLTVLLLCVPFLMYGQQQIQDNSFQGESYRHFVQSILLPAQILTAPTHGIAYWEETGTLQGQSGGNTLVYVPNADFAGEEVIEFYYWQGFMLKKEVVLRLMVKKSEVFAEDDRASTGKGEAVIVNVLDNDTQTNGSIQIREVLASNNAVQVTVNPDGTITYYPADGFSGLAYVDYLVCNDAGACDEATVHVNVENRDGFPAEVEELELTVTQHGRKPILLALEGYSVTTSPEKGFLDPTEDVLCYVPYGTETGMDEIVFQSDNDNRQKHVRINILEHAINKYAIDDVVFTPVNQAVEIDFLENDQGANDFSSVDILSSARYGSVVTESNGVVTYTPNNGYQSIPNNSYSIDRFTYEVKTANTTEVATVYIYVNDFKPAASTFELVTPKNTPLGLQYEIPIHYDRFEVATQGDLGKLSFHKNINQEILGQQVQGEKVLLYTPNEGVVGIDEVEVLYCISARSTNCTSVKLKIEILDIEVPDEHKCILHDCVWAGDANNDGMIDMHDLLTLGFHIGEVGTARSNPDITNWYGQRVGNWGTAATYADTYGNGSVSASDTSVISAHYGRTHKILPTAIAPIDPMPTYYGRPDTLVVDGPNDRIEFPIILGNRAFPAIDIYGLTFDINYSPNVFVPGTATIEFNEDAWLSYGSPKLSMIQEPYDGKAEIGFTRTNETSASGEGEVATFSIITVIDIDAFRLENQVITPITITASGINSAGQRVRLGSMNYPLLIKKPIDKEETTTDLDNASKLSVYPNPAKDILNVHLRGLDRVERLEVYTLTGKRIYTSKLDNQRLNVQNWNDGIYLIKAYTVDGGIINQKFEVLR